MGKSIYFTKWESALQGLDSSKLVEMKLGELSSLAYIFLDKLIHIVSATRNRIKETTTMVFGVFDYEPEVSFLNDGILHCSVHVQAWDIPEEKIKAFADLIGKNPNDIEKIPDSDGIFLDWEIHFLPSELQAYGIKSVFN